jgi:hypothetical protein
LHSNDPAKTTLDANGKADVPFVAPNSMLLQFQADTTQAEIDDFISSKKLEVVKTFPNLGAIQVKVDLSKFFQPQLGDSDGNAAVVRGLVAASEDFKKDPRIRAASPDLLLRNQSEQTTKEITNLIKPSVVILGASIPGKIEDWGVDNIQANKLWSLPGAKGGVIFGVMDVGFAEHEDLVFIELPAGTAKEDHGNHVAGIACGSHSNPRGVRGVLPNCFVRARSGNVFFQNVEAGKVTQFFVLFSQILATMETFVNSSDEVHTFNVSLGYNWSSNFGINPDAPESKDWRSLVEMQGVFLVTLLQTAEKKGKVIFSAAGNDSSGLATPIGAKYASPFNWAAIAAREQGINNGVIIEAHDKDGKRAGFSNVGGHLSCPGVDITSAVAFDDKHLPSASAYGVMSGTSMASPYCAAGHTLFRLVRPAYSGEDALACLLKSSVKSDSGIPMLKLMDAVNACP